MSLMRGVREAAFARKVLKQIDSFATDTEDVGDEGFTLPVPVGEHVAEELARRGRLDGVRLG